MLGICFLFFVRKYPSSCVQIVLELRYSFFCFCLSYGRWTSMNVVLGYQSHVLQRCHPACSYEGSSYLSPVLAYDFLSRCKFSTLTPRQPSMVEVYLLAFSRFPLRRNENLCVYVCVCVFVRFLPIYSGRQVRWMYRPRSHRRKVTQDFSFTLSVISRVRDFCVLRFYLCIYRYSSSLSVYSTLRRPWQHILRQ